jgi:hypothetical protein
LAFVGGCGVQSAPRGFTGAPVIAKPFRQKDLEAVLRRAWG